MNVTSFPHTSFFFPFAPYVFSFSYKININWIAHLIQKRQGHSNSKSRSEKFNPHPEEVASGFPIDPPRPSQVTESNVDPPQGHPYKRASHSGPLAHRAAWAKAGKNLDDASKISTGADLSAMSGLAAVRRSLLSEERSERCGSSQGEAPKLMTRFPGSFKETSETLIQQDQKHHCQGSHQKDDGRISSKDPVLVSYCNHTFFSHDELFLSNSLSRQRCGILVFYCLLHPKSAFILVKFPFFVLSINAFFEC